MSSPLFSKTLALAIMLMFFHAPIAPAIAQNATPTAADLAPADAGVFIHVKDLTALRKEWESDPLATYLKENLPEVFDKKAPGWTQAKTALGLTDEQMFDKFFGTEIAIVFNKQGDQDPAMVISRITKDDARLATQKLGFKSSGKQGVFTLYESNDKKSYVAAGLGWVIITDTKYRNQVTTLIKEQTKSLAASKRFKTATSKLPANRIATIYAHDNDKNETHVASASKVGRDLSLFYSGYSPQFANIFKLVQNAESLDFGPLPASTIATVSVNLLDPEMKLNSRLSRLFPKTKPFSTHVLPGIKAPAVAFLGEVASDQITSEKSPAIPVVGVSFKLKDSNNGKPSQAAKALTDAINGVMIIANFAAANWDAPEIETRSETYKKQTYQVAEVGVTLASRMKREEVKAMNLAFGQVGNWYLICTQDQYFKATIDANENAALQLSESPAFKAMNLTHHKKPILTAVLQPKMLATHVNSWLAHWAKVRPQVIKAANSQVPSSPEAKIIKGVRITAGLLEHYKSMSIQAYQDGEQLSAIIQISRD